MNITITTADIVLAATAKALGYKIVKIARFGNKGDFTIEVPEEFLEQFDLGAVLVEPVSFNSCIKQLTTAARRLADSPVH